MSRTKIDFGIDLGTTNSTIAVDGAVVKSPKFMKDTTPSCVAINKKKKITVGDDNLSSSHFVPPEGTCMHI